jgi:hypothetical protein
LAEQEGPLASFEAIVRVKGTKEGKSRFITIPFATADRLRIQGGEYVRVEIKAMWEESKKA